MIPTAFEYERATSLDDALAKLTAAGSAGKLIAGGHSLVPLMKLRLSEPTVLIDIAHIPDLAGIREAGGRIEIGAGTTHHDVGLGPAHAAARWRPRPPRRSAISRSATGARWAAAWRTPTRPPTIPP